jgi:hypothetical protein
LVRRRAAGGGGIAAGGESMDKLLHATLLKKFTDTETHLRGPAPQEHWTPPSSDKTVSMQLSWIDATKRYKIINITNTGYYVPDQWILQEDIHKISAMPRWNFSVTSPDYIAMLFGLAKNVPLPFPLP